MKSIDEIIAALIDGFKTKNPRLFLIIALALSATIYTASQGELLGLITLNGTAKTGVIVVTWIAALLTGSRTSVILRGDTYQQLQTNYELLKSRHNQLSKAYDALRDNHEQALDRYNEVLKECQLIAYQRDNLKSLLDSKNTSTIITNPFEASALTADVKIRKERATKL